MRDIKFTFLVFFLGSVAIKAQDSSLSTYGYYKLGEKKASSNASAYGMGGISTVYESPFGSEINFSNPAANTRIKRTLFGVGISSDLPAYAKALYFSDIYFGFAANEKLFFAIGAQPYLIYPKKGYLLDKSTNSGEELTSHGNGGVDTLHGLVQYKLSENLSLGVMGQYLFGTLEDTLTKKDKAIDYRQRETLNAFRFKLGALYSKNYQDGKMWSIGSTYDKSVEINLHKVKLDDSNLESEKVIETLQLPSLISLGVSYGEEFKWMVGSQFDWEEISNFNDIKKKGNASYSKKRGEKDYENRYRISLGGYWIPQYNSYKEYFPTITYRAGIHYENKGIKFEEKSTREYGVSFGLSFPLRKDLGNPFLPFINVNLGVGQRSSEGFKSNQKYVHANLGFSFGEKWFREKIYN